MPREPLSRQAHQRIIYLGFALAVFLVFMASAMFAFYAWLVSSAMTPGTDAHQIAGDLFKFGQSLAGYLVVLVVVILIGVPVLLLFKAVSVVAKSREVQLELRALRNEDKGVGPRS